MHLRDNTEAIAIWASNYEASLMRRNVLRRRSILARQHGFLEDMAACQRPCGVTSNCATQPNVRRVPSQRSGLSRDDTDLGTIGANGCRPILPVRSHTFRATCPAGMFRSNGLGDVLSVYRDPGSSRRTRSIQSDTMSITLHDFGGVMTQVTARLPDSVVDELDAAASQLRRSRAEIIRHAIERYLEDFDDLAVAIDRLRDPSDPVLDWDQVRRDLLDSD